MLEFDGMSENWVDSSEAGLEMRTLPEWRDIILPDEEHFLDMKAQRVLMLDHQVIQIGAEIDITGDATRFI